MACELARLRIRLQKFLLKSAPRRSELLDDCHCKVPRCAHELHERAPARAGGELRAQFFGAPSQIQPLIALSAALGRELPALGICEPVHSARPSNLSIR